MIDIGKPVELIDDKIAVGSKVVINDTSSPVHEMVGEIIDLKAGAVTVKWLNGEVNRVDVKYIKIPELQEFDDTDEQTGKGLLKFRNFMESIVTNQNKEVIGIIKKGFKICFEGYDELMAAMNINELQEIASKYAKPGSTLEMFGEFGNLADTNQRNQLIKEVNDELEGKLPTVNDDDIEELNKLLTHLQDIPLDDIDSPLDVDTLGNNVTAEEEEMGKKLALEYIEKLRSGKLESINTKIKQPESITISCISLINKCLRYLEIKGDYYLPNRLINYMNKLDLLYGDFNNESQMEFDDIQANFKNMNINQIMEKLVNLRGILTNYLPQEIRHLEQYL